MEDSDFFYGGDDEHDPEVQSYYDHLAAHVENGEMTIQDAMAAAALAANVNRHDITVAWRSCLIVLGHQDLANKFREVTINQSPRGLGIGFKTPRDHPFDPREAQPWEREAMDQTVIAVLRSGGIVAKFEDGHMVVEGNIPPFGDDEEDVEQIVAEFVQQMDSELDEQSPFKRWSKPREE